MKKIENEMIEWKMVEKRWKIRKSGNDEILFEERDNLKYKKGNMVYIIHRGDCKRKLDPNPHASLVFMLVLGQVMLDSWRSRSSAWSCLYNKLEH